MSRILQYLPGWLRPVDLLEGGARQQAIAATASGLAGSVRDRAILDLVELAHGVGHSTAFPLVQAAMRENDPTFACGPHELETQIIASTAVASLMFDADPRAASIAAMGTLSARWTGATPAVPDLPPFARECLIERSEALRRRVPVPVGRPEDIDFSAVPDRPADGTGAINQDLMALKAAAVAAIGGVQQDLIRVLRQLTNRAEASDEELDVLWWAFSEFSTRGARRWHAIKPLGVRAALAGAELAALTKWYVPLPSSEAILARILTDGDAAISIVDAIGAGSGGLLDDLSLPQGHPLLPILSSMSEYRDLDGREAWIDSTGRWGIDPRREGTALEFAHQMLRELLLQRALDDK